MHLIPLMLLFSWLGGITGIDCSSSKELLHGRKLQEAVVVPRSWWLRSGIFVAEYF
jgi:hypothetical protein